MNLINNMILLQYSNIVTKRFENYQNLFICGQMCSVNKTKYNKKIIFIFTCEYIFFNI